MRLTRLILIAIVTLALTGCGKRKAAPEVEVQGEYMLMSEYCAALGDSVELSQWRDVYLPFKFNLYAPAQVSLSGRATMVRDSAIYLSIRVMGIEGAAALITPDSVFVHDKYHKIYIADDASAFMSGIGLSPLQSALLGQPFEPGPVLDSICWVLPTAMAGVIESMSIDLPEAAQAYFAYSQWAQTERGLFAGQSDLLVFPSPESESPSVQASVEWNLGNAKFDTGRSVQFKPPRDLKPMRFSDLAPLLMDMQ
ncbi:MAG: DUF4292 domain-containing protein [Muribaculaceae bacterium]|nr:DUF4292 domain-containing protein [Muribaculaceae bacterium]